MCSKYAVSQNKHQQKSNNTFFDDLAAFTRLSIFEQNVSEQGESAASLQSADWQASNKKQTDGSRVTLNIDVCMAAAL